MLYHPSCWVRNDGCSTQREHRTQPVAEAYVFARPISEPHPGEGTRIVRRGSPPAPDLPPQPIPAHARPIQDAGGVIGGEDPVPPPSPDAPPERRRAPAPYVVPEQVTGPPRRYQPPPAEAQVVRKPLPSLYRTNRWLAYWHIPVAVVLALTVAAGVIFLAEALFGGGDDETPPAPSATAPLSPSTAGGSATAAASTSTPASTGTPAISATSTNTPSPAATGKFRKGDTLVVSGTGECLNVRAGAGLENQVVACVPDNTQLTVLGGPEQNGGLVWWKVSTPQGDGWAAEDYLARKP